MSNLATGALYDPNGVVVGNAVLYVSYTPYTPLPTDSSTLFDASPWLGKTLTLNGATSITLQVVTSAGTQTTAALGTIATMTAAQLQTTLAALSNVGAGNVLVTGNVAGPFQILFNGSLGAVALSISASTGGTGPTVTGGLWMTGGGSEQGWSVAGNTQTQDITIEEQSTPVGTTITGRTFNITGNLSEDVMRSWQLGFNGTLAQIAQGVGQPAVSVLTLSDKVQHYSVALEMANRFGLARRIYIPDAVCLESPTVAFRRAAAQRLIGANFRSVCAIGDIQVRECTAPAL